MDSLPPFAASPKTAHAYLPGPSAHYRAGEFPIETPGPIDNRQGEHRNRFPSPKSPARASHAALPCVCDIRLRLDADKFRSTHLSQISRVYQPCKSSIVGGGGSANALHEFVLEAEPQQFGRSMLLLRAKRTLLPSRREIPTASAAAAGRCFDTRRHGKLETS